MTSPPRLLIAYACQAAGRRGSVEFGLVRGKGTGMLRMLALSAVLAAVALPASAASPICLVPTVVDRMAAGLTGNPYYTRLDPRLIVESPTADPRVVRCAVCALITLYDTSRLGPGPVARCEPRAFTVRALRNGFVVSDPR